MSEANTFGRVGSRAEFGVGSALSRSFAVFGEGAMSFIVLTSIAYLPLLAVEIAALAAPAAAGALSVASFFVQMVVNAIATAACLFGAYQIMRGAPFTIGESLSAGLGRFWAVIGASLLSGLAIMLGMVLLFVPGVMLACAFFVALPACVIERLGPSASLSRSRKLTAGYRWGLFGLLLLIAVAGALATFGLAFVAGLLGGVIGGIVGGENGAALLGVLGVVLGQVVVGAFGSVLYAVVYHDLRVAKEGVDINRLTSVFD